MKKTFIYQKIDDACENISLKWKKLVNLIITLSRFYKKKVLKNIFLTTILLFSILVLTTTIYWKNVLANSFFTKRLV